MAINHDYTKVFYVEPNYNTDAEERINTPYYVHDMEDYCIYVDLEVEIYDRNIEGTNGAHTLLFSWKTNSDGSKTASFLSGSKIRYGGEDGEEGFQVLTTNYMNTHYDDIVHDNTTKQSQNPELFGIKSINIDYNNYAIPQVEITFTDIRGSSLFGPEEYRHHITNNGIGGFSDEDIAGSFFKCFFTFPYPKFTLRVKGFYGQGVSYELTCSKFITNFDSSKGNFDATASFVGYSYSLLNDISLNAVLAAPLSDYKGREYWVANGGFLDEVESSGLTSISPTSSSFSIKDENGQNIKMPTISHILASMDKLAEQSSQMETDNPELFAAASNNDAYVRQLKKAMGIYDEYCKEILKQLRAKGINQIYIEYINEDGSACNLIGRQIGGIVAFTSFRPTTTEPYLYCADVNVDKYNQQISKETSTINDVPYIQKSQMFFDVMMFDVFSGSYVIKNTNIFKNFRTIKSRLEADLTENKEAFTNLTNAYVFDGVAFCNKMNLLMQSLTNAKIEADKKIAMMNEKNITAVLGFKPTVDNVMAVIMAHLETLLHIIYTATDEVSQINQSETPRKIGDFGISERELTGLRIGTDEIVPAWPKVVTKDPYTQAWVDSWIGDFPSNGEAQPEAKAVNGLLNGIRHVQASIDEAASALNSGLQETTPMTTCASRVALPLVPSDVLTEGNPFGEDTLSQSENINDVFDDAISKMFVRMGNVLLVDNVRPYVMNGWDTNIRDSRVKNIGRIDAINFFDKYKDQFTTPFKQFITNPSSFNKEKIFERMNKTSAFWRNNNSEDAIKLYSRYTATNNYVFHKMFDDYHFFGIRRNESITKWLTDGGHYNNNRECFDCTIITENVHLLDNVENCYSRRYLNMENCQDETEAYETLFDYMFDEDYRKYDPSEIYGEDFRFDNDDNSYATYDKTFCYKRKYDGTDVVAYVKNSGNIPLAPRDAATARENSIIPVDSNIDFDEVVIRTEDGGTTNKERQKVSNDDLKRIAEYDDITTSDFTIPTVQFYDDGEWGFWGNSVPSTGVTLFSCPIYYDCKTILQKAFLFLDNLTMHDLEEAVDKMTNDDNDASSVFIYTTKVNLLLLGAYFELDTKDVEDFFSGMTSESISILSKKINKKRDKTDTESSDLKLFRPQAQDDLRDYFIKWAQEEYPVFDKEFGLRTKEGNSFTMEDCKKFLSIVKGEAYNGRNYDEYDLSNFVGENFYRNYSKICQDGAIFFRDETEIVKKLLKLDVQTVLFVNNYFDTSRDGSNRKEEVGGDNGDFAQYIEGFTLKLQDLVRSQLDKENSEQTPPRSEVADPHTEKDIQIALYKYLKLLHDKWLGSTSFESWKMDNFYRERFAYIDSYYYDIGDKVFINPVKMCDLICRSEAQKSFSLISFITAMLQENNLAFMCVQNFLKLKTENADGLGKTYVEAMEDMFKPIPFLEMKHMEDKPFFVTIYKGEPSSKLNINGAEYVDDSFMLNYGNSDLWPEAITNKTERNGYPIPAFGVTYGSQYQSYFSDVNVGMDSSMVTEQSLQAQYLIASMNSKMGGESANDKENGSNIFALGQDLYTVYSNNSYTCNVTMMGCAWVQPLMYFVLLNIPLFRGSYLIEKVKHSISPGNMVTTFTGVRMANTLTPFVKSPFYMKGENMDLSYANKYYKESDCANVDNDCKYAVFPVGDLKSDGGFNLSLLTENGGFGKYGLVTSKDSYTNRYSTLLEALTCTAIAECGAQDQLAIELVCTVLFNRVKKKGDFHIFSRGQISYDKATSSSHPEGYDSVYPIVENIFVNTPAVIVGKHTNVINPTSIYIHGELSEEKTSSVTITLDMVQKMYMYCSRQGYDESNKNDGKDHIVDTNLETNPSDWRKQTYLCHHDNDNIYGHVFTTGDGDKSYWTESKSADEGEIEDNGRTRLCNQIVEALNKTIAASKVINGNVMVIDYSVSEVHEHLGITMKDKTQNNTLFDIVLNAYSAYAYGVVWVCDNDNSFSTNDYPDSIYLSIGWSMSELPQISLAIDSQGGNKNPIFDDKFPKSFYKSVNKLLNVNSDSGVKLLKSKTSQCGTLTDEQLIQLFNGEAIVPCRTVKPRTYSGAYNPSTNRVGGVRAEWAAVINGGLAECGATKTKEDLDAAKAYLFGGQLPRTEFEAKKYIKTFMVDGWDRKIPIQLHEKLGDDMVAAFKEMKEAGFKVMAVGGYYWRPAKWPNGAPKPNRSNHSYGVAIDINGRHPNGYYEHVPSDYGTDDDLAGKIRTVDSKAVKIMAKHGWGWGGKYGDTMHFSYFNGN